jgi:hypothetical protein
LQRFTCSLNPEIQKFLREDAIAYEKAHKSRTYLFAADGPTDEHLEILGYFSVGLNILRLREAVSNSMKRKLRGIFSSNELPCYLIGQLGKNEPHTADIKGWELVNGAMGVFQMGHERIGGRFVMVDCKAIKPVCKFYTDNDFQFVQKDDERDLLQYVRLL